MCVSVCVLLDVLSQLTMERDEHKLVVEQLSKLEPERKAFRLIGGVLVEKTVGESLPQVDQNYNGVSRSGICDVLFSVDRNP